MLLPVHKERGEERTARRDRPEVFQRALVDVIDGEAEPGLGDPLLGEVVEAEPGIRRAERRRRREALRLDDGAAEPELFAGGAAVDDDRGHPVRVGHPGGDAGRPVRLRGCELAAELLDRARQLEPLLRELVAGVVGVEGGAGRVFGGGAGPAFAGRPVLADPDAAFVAPVRVGVVHCLLASDRSRTAAKWVRTNADGVKARRSASRSIHSRRDFGSQQRSSTNASAFCIRDNIL